MKNVIIDQDIKIDDLLNKTSSFTGADIKNLINIAALNAVKE